MKVNIIYQRDYDCKIVEKIRLNRLHWTGYLILMDEDDPDEKVYDKERQTSLAFIEAGRLDAKPRRLFP